MMGFPRIGILSHKTYIGLFLGAAVATYVLVPLVKRLAHRLGAVDHPSDRRAHEGRVPTMGGLAVALPVFAGIGLLYLWPNAVSQEFFTNESGVLALLFGGALMVALGVYDDLRGSDAILKFGVQVVAALCVCAMSGWITVLGVPILGEIDLGVAAVPVTVFWIVAVTNAFNLIDGVDGLASGVGLLVCGGSFFLALSNRHVDMMVFSAVMGGALLAFLRFNFHPASIFLGDTGSLFIGFTIAVVSMQSSMKAPTVALMFIPVCAVGYPLLDMCLAVARRFIKGKPVFSSDRGHIHHKLLDCGLGHRFSSIVAYGFTLLFTGIAILEVYGRHRESGILLAIALFLLLAMFKAFGYWRFVRDRLDLALRRRYRLYHLVSQMARLKMRDADNLEEVWEPVRLVGKEFDLHSATLKLDGWFKRTWENPHAEDGEDHTHREYYLPPVDGVLKVSYVGEKEEDIQLEQNILLEEISEELAKNLVRLRRTEVAPQS